MPRPNDPLADAPISHPTICSLDPPWRALMLYQMRYGALYPQTWQPNLDLTGLSGKASLVPLGR